MERLTYRDRKGHAYFDDDGSLIRGANGTFHHKKDMSNQYIHQRFVALDKAVDRLAAYEDTGLLPEEINSIFIHSVLAENEQLKAELENLQAPPNPPLTLEELLEMDGMPVWVDQPDGYKWRNGWALVNVSWKAQRQVYAVYINGASDFIGILLAEGGKIYRHKPERSG